MKEIKTSIIPVFPDFFKIDNSKHEPDLKAICIFAATGFFLEQDTYWRDEKVLSPGSINRLNDKGGLENSSSWFEWNYNPRELSFKQALEEFTYLFEEIIKDQVKNSPVILPLSGGLDSRSQALALLRNSNEVNSYSYSFTGGYPESKIAREIAKVCGFPFKEFFIPNGYLWNDIQELAEINKCYSEFTHPRQMAVLSEFKKMDGIFSLGHWGDVLFDRGAPPNLKEGDQVSYLLKSVVKKSGMDLADTLWKLWELEGTFEEYLRDRFSTLLSAFDISNTSAKIRAFKSQYWAPRWTSTNLSIFNEAQPISLPYYDDRMCEFICTIPEKYLADRAIQIAYIKQHDQLSRITWEAHKPFNLHTYKKNRVPFNLPYRIYKKLQRESSALMGEKFIQRNWELQFLGDENEENLLSYLFDESFNQFIPRSLVKNFYNRFLNENRVQYSHSVSTLLTLALWNQNYNDGPSR